MHLSSDVRALNEKDFYQKVPLLSKKNPSIFFIKCWHCASIALIKKLLNVSECTIQVINLIWHWPYNEK